MFGGYLSCFSNNTVSASTASELCCRIEGEAIFPESDHCLNNVFCGGENQAPIVDASLLGILYTAYHSIEQQGAFITVGLLAITGLLLSTAQGIIYSRNASEQASTSSIHPWLQRIACGRRRVQQDNERPLTDIGQTRKIATTTPG